MARISSKVANWLYSVLQPQYLHKEVAYSHLYHFLSAYLSNGFKIRTAVYTSASGHSQLLINLHGRLDCGSCIVPLNIWIPLNYPFQDENIPSHEPNGVPVVFVVPEEGHSIRPTNNVDLQGRFYHPYLLSWYQKYTPTSQSKEYSLLSLMACLKATFEHAPPIVTGSYPASSSGPSRVVSPQRTGPELPPKPPKEGFEQSQAASPAPRTPEAPRRETTGPPVPMKPQDTREPRREPEPQIPEKYRSPLPLPQENVSSISQAMSSQSSLDSSQFIRPQSPRGPVPVQEQQNVQQRYFKSPVSEPKPSTSRTQPPKPVGMAEVEDLMDKVTLDAAQNNRPALQLISNSINAFLHSDKSVLSLKPYVEEQQKKADALHAQLSNHLKQAQANEEHLQKHVTYLQGQVDAIKKLNEELQALDQINSQSTDEVWTGSSGPKFKLEELITPDSILVNQLYDTVADIKAHRDSIDLVSGNFKGEPELINDDNMDACIKSVRGLARDLFWLEVTKNEIGKSMQLRR